ncbi:hypothetical protein [Sneathiella glossodoripedis]|uniref:hypothetical protein n=1 Tax=Sneathiella glossodoripedis TaxID=418853 RepID=UPI00046F8F51|nr:hypothetical protein [Sneathiella glossodoripedis]
MTCGLEPSTVAVYLKEETVKLLFTHQQSKHQTLDEIIYRLAKTKFVSTAQLNNEKKSKYKLTFLGTHFHDNSLPTIFGQLIDHLATTKPEYLQKLAIEKARTRQYVSRNQEKIHPGRPDLKTVKTKSGWWISANIGFKDLERALEALCKSANLAYLEDIKLFDLR